MSAGDFDKEFNDMVNEITMVEPLGVPSILEGLKNLVEANLYIQDFLSEFFLAMQSATDELTDSEEEISDEIYLEMPAFSHKATVYLTLLFDAARSFCDVVTEEVEEG